MQPVARPTQTQAINPNGRNCLYFATAWPGAHAAVGLRPAGRVGAKSRHPVGRGTTGPTPNPLDRPPNFATSLIPHLPLLLTSQPLPFLIEQYSTGTGPSAHNTCAERDAKTNSCLPACDPHPSIPCIPTCLSKSLFIVSASTTTAVKKMF